MAGILKPEEEDLIKAAGSIIKAVGYKYSAAVGTVITAAEKAATVHKIVNITSRFCHKLNSKLGVIGDKLPSNAEMFKLYTQCFLTAEDSQAVYNKLINTGILNDAGEVIEKDRGKIVTKIRALDLERNDQFKNKVIIFCFKLQDLEGKSKQETRDRIAFNAEQMITNRIMQLVKAEVLSPAIGTVMGSGVNAITDKLRQASELSKHRIKQEMQKHYSRVTLTVDEPNLNTETPVDQPKIENPFRYLNLKKLASTASFCSPLSPEMLEALRNPKAAAEAAAAKQKALDDWYEDPRIKCHLPYERYTSMFMSDATAAVKQKALDAWYNDPRIKCHLPYERYTSMFMSHSNTATTATETSSTKDNSAEDKVIPIYDSVASLINDKPQGLKDHMIPFLSNFASYTADTLPAGDSSTTAQDIDLLTTSRDIETPSTSSVQVKLSSINTVEGSASGTAQAAEISLPVFEAIALKYGPKVARGFAKFALKNGMRLIPGVGLAITAHDVYDIAGPTIYDIYNRLMAGNPAEASISEARGDDAQIKGQKAEAKARIEWEVIKKTEAFDRCKDLEGFSLDELVQRFADESHDIVQDVLSQLPPLWKGENVLGILKHDAAHKLHDGYEEKCKDERLTSEKHWRKEDELDDKTLSTPGGTKGSVRLDVKTNIKKHPELTDEIYDYKFGKQGIKKKDLKKWIKHTKSTIFKEVRPTEQGGITKIFQKEGDNEFIEILPGEQSKITETLTKDKQ